jgi:hypothetical protein
MVTSEGPSVAKSLQKIAADNREGDLQQGQQKEAARSCYPHVTFCSQAHQVSQMWPDTFA